MLAWALSGSSGMAWRQLNSAWIPPCPPVGWTYCPVNTCAAAGSMSTQHTAISADKDPFIRSPDDSGCKRTVTAFQGSLKAAMLPASAPSGPDEHLLLQRTSDSHYRPLMLMLKWERRFYRGSE